MQTAITAPSMPQKHPRHLCDTRLTRDCRGMTQFEYAVLFVVICVGTLGAWIYFGRELSSIF
jgi:Flp pilus assembly pilin Flp